MRLKGAVLSSAVAFLVTHGVEAGCQTECLAQCQTANNTAEISDPAYLSTFLLSTQDKYAGEPVRMMVVDWQMSYLEQSLIDFCTIAGCVPSIEVTTNANWYTDVDLDLAGAEICDGYMVSGAWMPDFASQGLLLSLTDRVGSATAIDWLDIFPSVRDNSATYEGDVYMVPLDGDFIQAVYRKDLLEAEGMTEPRTFEEMADTAEYFHGMDFNNDGESDFGVCFSSASADIAGQIFWSAMAPFLQTEGTEEGVFFDPDTMEPKLSTDPAFKTAMEIYKRLVLASPYAVHGPTGWFANNGYFDEGRCALYFNFPGPVKMLISGQAKNNLTDSLVVAKLPGISCSDCTYADDEGISYAPFYAGGGTSGTIRATANTVQQDIMFDYMTFISDPEIGFLVVADPGTLLDPFRQSHVDELDDITSAKAQAFMNQGWEERQLVPLKDMIEEVFSSPNAAQDLRILGSNEYTETSTTTYNLEYWAGTKTLDETVVEMTAAWNDVTEKYGFESQRAQYRSGLGIGPYVETLHSSRSSETHFEYVLYAVLAVLGVAFLIWSVVQISRYVETAQRLKQERKESINTQIKNARNSVMGIRGQFCVVSAAKYLEFGRFKSHEELRDKGDLFFFDTMKEASIFLSQAENFCVFFSHQWLGWSIPDPENIQYKAGVKALQGIATKETKDLSNIFVWYDYGSIPQRAPELQKLAIISLPTFASIVDSFVVIAPDAKHADSGQYCGRASYLKRAWCRAEVMSHWARKGTSTMYWATDSGLELMAPGRVTEDFLNAVDVFGGDLTCCR